MIEGINFDKKSLKAIIGRTSEFNELAKDCVAFANAKGGIIIIGIEDDSDLPPKGQFIQEDIPEKAIKRLNELTINVGLQYTIKTAKNGSNFIELNISRSASTVACTSNGHYYIRDSDRSRPIMPDELIRLSDDKTAYSWETKVTQKITYRECDQTKLNQFINDIHKSNRVSQFVKEKSTSELLSHYLMIDGKGFLTNLGILWIGLQEQRARLLYSPTIQYIKYDQDENKVNKIVWDDYSYNPKELIESVWKEIPDWKETNEVSDGLWRKTIPAYDEKVVREVLCNALVHRPYTTRGDIFINIYTDRMEIANPGTFPLGVTTTNILHQTVQRNEHLAKIFYDLHLMEKEGSGYDLMYETLLSVGKEAPKPYEGNDFVRVTIFRKIINQEAARLIELIKSEYSISSKGIIALGLIIQNKTISAIELSSKLQLSEEERVRSYLQSLTNNNIIVSKGKGKGTKYYVNPQIIANSKANITTCLKTVEPYRLKALIEEDLRFHPNSSADDICKRLPDADIVELHKLVREMAKNGDIFPIGGRKYRTYKLPNQ